METNYTKQQKSAQNKFQGLVEVEFPKYGEEQKASRPFLQNRLGKPMHASSLFSPDKKHRLTMVRRISTDELQTKSLKDLNLKGNSIRSRNNFNRKEDDFQQDLQSQYNYNQNLVRLKVEEMIFKFKTRIGALLKEMGISVVDLNRFTSLNRIDDILDCLSEKVKEMLAKRDIKNTEIAKVRSKEQDLLNEYEIQLESLKKKQQEKEAAEKGYKQRLKEAHSQIRQLYDRVNKREKELSTKMTEIYQAKVITEESDKVVAALKEKYSNLEKECASLRDNNSAETKKTIAALKTLQDSNIDLKDKNEELVELIQRYESKEKRMIDLNRQLNQQLERWRQRFESKRVDIDPVKQSESVTQKVIKTAQSIDVKEFTSNQGAKISQLALLNENSRLSFKTTELQKQNRQLNRQLAKYSSLQQKYNELVTFLNTEKQQNSIDIQQSDSSGQYRSKYRESETQIELFYKKKVEENARQWREKLIEIVNTYQEQAEKNKKTISELMINKEDLEGKVQQLAIMKYKVENQLIEKDREIYQMSRSKRENSRVISSLEFTQKTPEKGQKYQQIMTESKEVEETPIEENKEFERLDVKVEVQNEQEGDS